MKSEKFIRQVEDAKANPAIIASAWVLAFETGREFDDMLARLASMYVNAKWCDEKTTMTTKKP